MAAKSRWAFPDNTAPGWPWVPNYNAPPGIRMTLKRIGSRDFTVAERERIAEYAKRAASRPKPADES